MEFNDFWANFRNVYYCRVFEDQWQETLLQGEWRGESAGGCSNNKNSYYKNPHFRMSVPKKTTCFILLQQEETRGTGREEYALGISIFKLNGDRLPAGRSIRPAYKTKTYQYSRDVSVELEIDGSNQPYTLVPATFEAGEEGKFTITIYAKGGGVLIEPY